MRSPDSMETKRNATVTAISTTMKKAVEHLETESIRFNSMTRNCWTSIRFNSMTRNCSTSLHSYGRRHYQPQLMLRVISYQILNIGVNKSCFRFIQCQFENKQMTDQPHGPVGVLFICAFSLESSQWQWLTVPVVWLGRNLSRQYSCTIIPWQLGIPINSVSGNNILWELFVIGVVAAI